jgi:thioredoxin reductase (NADPH)
MKNVKNRAASTLPVAGVFIAVGLSPNSQAFRECVPCDEKGYIIAGEDGVTQTPGIFAAGDIRTKKLRQIVTAVADGAVAVNSAREYLLLQKC